MFDSKPMLDHSQPAYSVDQHRPASEPMVARFKIFFLGTYLSCAFARSPAAKMHSLFAGSRDCSKRTRRKQSGLLS